MWAYALYSRGKQPSTIVLFQIAPTWVMNSP